MTSYDKLDNFLLSALKMKKFNRLNQKSYKNFSKFLKNEKKRLNIKGNSKVLNDLWLLQTILELFNLYIDSYYQISKKKYLESWKTLERCEILIGNILKNYNLNEIKYDITFIQINVKQLQSLFPYRVFISPEMLIKEKKCSICGKIVSLRNPCNHKKGKLYNGEICLHRITDFEILRLSIVTNPGHKYSVLKLPEKDYNYDVLKYLFSVIETPFEKWEAIHTQKRHPHKFFADVSITSPCPCKSGKKYEECCLKENGVLMPHIVFNFDKKISSDKIGVKYFY